MTRPLVSIIIPTYNHELYIAKTIDSVTRQTYSNLEIVVSDDCSTDNTEKVVREYEKKDGRVKYYRNNNNIGRVRNYRKLLYELCSGDYVLNVDGDDFLIYDYFIEEAINNLTNLEDLDINLIVACKQMENQSGSFYKLYHKINKYIEVIDGNYFVYKIFDKYQFSHLTTIYSRKKAIDSNFYSLDILSTDVDSLLRLALKSKVLLFNHIVGQWNTTERNESQTTSIEKWEKNFMWIQSVYYDKNYYLNIIQKNIWRIRMTAINIYPLVYSIHASKRQYKYFDLFKVYISYPISFHLFLFRYFRRYISR